MSGTESADSGFNTQKKLFQGQSIGKPFVGDLPERPPGTGQDGGFVAGRAELWHICVFIVAQGMENRAGEGGVKGWGSATGPQWKCIRLRVRECVLL